LVSAEDHLQGEAGESLGGNRVKQLLTPVCTSNVFEDPSFQYFPTRFLVHLYSYSSTLWNQHSTQRYCKILFDNFVQIKKAP
jgi:hypothetical protein